MSEVLLGFSLCTAQHSHVNSLFTNEEQKKVGSQVNRSLYSDVSHASLVHVKYIHRLPDRKDSANFLWLKKKRKIINKLDHILTEKQLPVFSVVVFFLFSFFCCCLFSFLNSIPIALGDPGANTCVEDISCQLVEQGCWPHGWTSLTLCFLQAKRQLKAKPAQHTSSSKATNKVKQTQLTWSVMNL